MVCHFVFYFGYDVVLHFYMSFSFTSQLSVIVIAEWSYSLSYRGGNNLV